jgi:hypothetical protein
MTKESTKTAPAEISYNALTQQVTIRTRGGGVIVLPIQDAMWLGGQLITLLNPTAHGDQMWAIRIP